MRMLIWHMDAFAAEPEQRGRSKIADAEPRVVRVEEALVVFAACEKADESEPEAVAVRAAEAIVQVARQTGARTIVLHSFSHLFVELSTPAIARTILDQVEVRLTSEGYTVHQTAFGWFNIAYSSSNAARATEPDIWLTGLGSGIMDAAVCHACDGANTM
jgi:KaiC/GvpD/RAD55 family RecA-like ATPase